MPVDSFKFLPRLIGVIYETTEVEELLPVPWTPLTRPVEQCKFGLVTTGGLYHGAEQPPFDLEREIREPTWGDPSYRAIPADITQEELGISHLHVNNQPVKTDLNILLPIQRFLELEEYGEIGGVAQVHYSFMGYQGYPPDTTAWQEVYGPEVADRFIAEGVDCVLLTPS